jgi:hypothetical protein
MISSSARRISRTLITHQGALKKALVQPTFSLRPMATVTSTSLRRQFSTDPTAQAGFVEKPLKALDLALVRQIKSDLMEFDANSDGR